jgi:tRNA threonylcarbamoyladenosine biosynthesis protein TsaE
MKENSESPQQTQQIAARLAQSLPPGSCIALEGELGAGKTQFVRGMVQGLGGNLRAVSSPTFVLLNVYETTRMKVFHLDAYRVHGAEDFEAIGFSELLEQGGLVVVEWGKRIERLLPPGCIHITIEQTGETQRSITIDQWPGEGSIPRASSRGV